MAWKRIIITFLSGQWVLKCFQTRQKLQNKSLMHRHVNYAMVSINNAKVLKLVNVVTCPILSNKRQRSLTHFILNHVQTLPQKSLHVMLGITVWYDIVRKMKIFHLTLWTYFLEFTTYSFLTASITFLGF